MATVFLLGSGFSRAISTHMPIMRELSAQIANDLKKRGRPALPKSDTPLVDDFERWLSYLVDAPPWLSPSDVLTNRAAFEDVATSLRGVLSADQIKAMGDPQPDWLQQLVTYWEETGSVVITFNYDLLVEASWCAMGGSASYVYIYSVPLTPALARRGGAVHPGHQPTYGMRLLKLHGSLSWWYSGPGSPPGDIVYNTGIGPTSWFGQHPDDVWIDDEIDTIDKVSLIVPPAAVKSPYYGNRIIRSLWEQAASAIRSAEELVVMGFSFPPSDQIVGSLVATEMSPAARITPVDVSHGVVENLKSHLGPDSDERFDTRFIGDNAIEKWVYERAILRP